MGDTTTKFQSKFDLFQILKEAGVNEEDTADIIYFVQNNNRLVAEVEELKQELDTWKKSYTDMHEAQLHGVKAVREREKEIEQLKEELKSTKQVSDTIYYLLEENEKDIKQLKEALKKCGPYVMVEDDECKKCGQTIGELYCVFCQSPFMDEKHFRDCKYVQLCKDEKGDGEDG